MQVLGPVPGTVTHDSGEGDGTGPNNASLVLLVEVRGLRLLLAGDVEPEAQRALARAWPGLAVDVLKVPHHGSRYQEESWLLGLGARLAVVSVGADNDYGHPSRRLSRHWRRPVSTCPHRPRRGRRGQRTTNGRGWPPAGRAICRSSQLAVGPLWQAVRTMAGHARKPSPADVLGRVTLITGPEEFLNERTISAVRVAVRSHDSEAELSEAVAGDLTLATLGEMAAPSLFSSTRCVVVRALENLPDESVAGLLDYCSAPVEDVALVLAHSGGRRAPACCTKLRKLAPVTEVKSEPLRMGELAGFVASEVAATAGRSTATLQPSLWRRSDRTSGHWLRRTPLSSDFPGDPLSLEKVKRYFGGPSRGQVLRRRRPCVLGPHVRCLEELRWALDGGTPPVLVTSAFAGGARGLARLVSSPRGMRDNDLPPGFGVPRGSCAPCAISRGAGPSPGWSAPSALSRPLTPTPAVFVEAEGSEGPLVDLLHEDGIGRARRDSDSREHRLLELAGQCELERVRVLEREPLELAVDEDVDRAPSATRGTASRATSASVCS